MLSGAHMVLLPDGSDCRGTNSHVVPFMLELVLTSGKPVVNFASVTMSWVFPTFVIGALDIWSALFVWATLFRLVV